MKTISFGQALAHCASTGSYWFWIAIAVVALVIGFILIKKSLKTSDWQTGHSLAVGGLILILLLAVLMRPAEVAANTTEDQAARGVYIGY